MNENKQALEVQKKEKKSMTIAEQSKNLSTGEWTQDQIDLLKRTVAKGTTDDEFALFCYVAKKTGLDPFVKQIHAVKRWSSDENREIMSIQTGIDGYRLTADRTGKYVPGKEPVFNFDGEKLVSATAHIKKLVGGEWHEISATAFYDEYVQTRRDGKPNRMWGTMPKSQLAKCAEALALRKGFPAELSGVRTDEEMEQADNAVHVESTAQTTELPQMPRLKQTAEVPPFNGPAKPGGIIKVQSLEEAEVLPITPVQEEKIESPAVASIDLLLTTLGIIPSHKNKKTGETTAWTLITESGEVFITRDKDLVGLIRAGRDAGQFARLTYESSEGVNTLKSVEPLTPEEAKVSA